MTGPVADGQDIVKETLARGYYSLAEVEKLPPLHDGEHLDQTYSTSSRRLHPFMITPTASIAGIRTFSDGPRYWVARGR